MQAELFAQRHVHRNIGRRAAGEKSRHAAFAQAGEHQREGVAPRLRKHQQRIDHQRHHGHCPQQHGQQVDVLVNALEAFHHDGGEHQPEDAQRREADDPAHHAGDGLSQIGQHGPRAVCGMAQRNAQQHGPAQNADVVARRNRLHRVGHQVHQQVAQHLGNAAGRHLLGRLHALERKRGRKGETGRHGHQRGRERAHQIQRQNGADVGRIALAVLRHRREHQHKHHHRRRRLERAHEQPAQQLAQLAHQGHELRRSHVRIGRQGVVRHSAHQNARRQADDDLHHQPQPVQPGDETLFLHCLNS